MNNNTYADIELLRTWAPMVLGARYNADPDDLKEIIRIRARLDVTVTNDLENNGAAYFILMEVDRICAPLAPSLLFLPNEDAEAAAAEVGGQLNPSSWYGIHNWASTQVLDRWAWMINESVTNDMTDVTRAEVAQAFLQYDAAMGMEYINKFFFNDRDEWREWLDSDDREGLTRIILRNRQKSSQAP